MLHHLSGVPSHSLSSFGSRNILLFHSYCNSFPWKPPLLLVFVDSGELCSWRYFWMWGIFWSRRWLPRSFRETMLDLNTNGVNEKPNILWLSLYIHVQAERLKEAGCKIKPGKFSPVQTSAWLATEQMSAQRDRHRGLGNPRAAADYWELLTRIHISWNEVFV